MFFLFCPSALVRHLSTVEGVAPRTNWSQMAGEYQEALVIKSTQLVNLFVSDELFDTAEVHLHFYLFYVITLSRLSIFQSLPRDQVNSSLIDCFEALEKLYFVLQELSFPLPSRLSNKMLAMAWVCLPVDLFLQYVDVGVVVLTPVCARI